MVTTRHTAIVTGANHGIGAATAKALARRGCAVLCTFLRVNDPADPGTPQTYRDYRAQDAAAVVARIREDGGNPFYDYQIPQAALALKQGFGRLIRSKTDRGVLVLLDNRITKQRYGQVFFDSLPDYGFTTNLSDVERFFDV